MPNTNETELQLSGITASPGICIGKAYLVGREGVDVVDKYFISEDNLQNEIKRFKTAVKNAKDNLSKIIETTPEELREHAHILETHKVLFKDKMLYGKTIETIKKERVNAEWALKKVVSNVKAMFRNMTDSYLQGRVDDIIHVSDSIMQYLVGAKVVDIAAIDKRVILVAVDLSPAETSQIQLEKIKGFITDHGGKTSHTGIIARSLEIPAVLGLDNATRIIKNDDIIIVDGTAGIVIVNPTEQTLIQFEEQKAGYEAYKAVMTRESYIPAETRDGIRLQILGNIELPEEVVSVIDYGGDGIGLYRTELQYLSRPDFPTEHELFDKYKDVIEVMAPKPVTIRTLDISGDKAVYYASNSDEKNPALGLRGIRYCLQRQDIFKTQLRAILRASVFGNVRIMYPMISCYDEVLHAKRILSEVADSLDKEGLDFNKNVKIGIMIETPSAVILADVLARDVDFFSIGTNDLVQYSLAVDRVNKKVAHLYQPLNPAIIRMIKHVADVARDKGVDLFMCGEMAGDPINIPILLGLGIEKLSMNPQSIPVVKNIIKFIDAKNSRLFIKKVLKETTDTGVTELVLSTYGNILFETGYTDM
ncbi:MAG: phosphoenolpyruvate--protein phosphotransferase [Thermodesulfobacteriota bacterium]|nr:phosphoenolpyruvate--protein phosphotransferase [Thermodesulfobacteriota bacterium]